MFLKGWGRSFFEGGVSTEPFNWTKSSGLIHRVLNGQCRHQNQAGGCSETGATVGLETSGVVFGDRSLASIRPREPRFHGRRFPRVHPVHYWAQVGAQFGAQLDKKPLHPVGIKTSALGHKT